MPMRYIQVPSPVTLRDPVSKEPLRNQDGVAEVWSFPLMLNKLMGNPKWAESFANMRSQNAIETALEEMDGDVMVLAEEDWMKLREAAESPKAHVNTPSGVQVVSGFGIHPSLSRQLVGLLAPIIDAKTERPPG